MNNTMNPLDDYRLQCERMQARLEDMNRMLKVLQSEVKSLMADLAVTVAHLEAEEISSPVPETAALTRFETPSTVEEIPLAVAVPYAILSAEPDVENNQECVEPAVIPEPVLENAASVKPETVPFVSEETTSSQAFLTSSVSTQTLAQQFEQAAKPNLQQSLGGVHSSDFLKSLSLNDRFRLTRELFRGDSGAFAEAVTIISNASNSRDAIGYLRQTVHWDEKNEAVMEFRERIEQFFQQK